MRTIFLIYLIAFIGISLACSAVEGRHLPGKEIVLYSENIRSSFVSTEDNAKPNPSPPPPKVSPPSHPATYSENIRGSFVNTEDNAKPNPSPPPPKVSPPTHPLAYSLYSNPCTASA